MTPNGAPQPSFLAVPVEAIFCLAGFVSRSGTSAPKENNWCLKGREIEVDGYSNAPRTEQITLYDPLIGGSGVKV